MSSRSNRRSARNRKEIVAPGFGTASDIQRLSQELGGSLPVAAVTAMMRAEGRGIRGKSDDSSADAPNPLTSPGTSNAWANFMQEEGVASNLFGGGSASQQEPEPSNKRRKTDDSSTKPASSAALASGGKLDYELAVLAASTEKSASFGSLVQSGTMDTTVVGRKSVKSTEEAVYHLNVPHSLMPKIAITKVFTSCNAAHAIALDKSNQAYGWGRNEGLCLGEQQAAETSGESAVTVIPTPTLIGSDIASAALGKSHTIFLQTDGSLHALGSNKVGQCGWRASMKQSGVLKACIAPKDVVFSKISCGEDFAIALDDQGVLYSTGSSEFGQLGNGETGEYFVSANKLAYANAYAFEPQVIYHHTDPNDNSHNNNNKKTAPLAQVIRLQEIACGKHHTIAIEAPASNVKGTRIFSWGCGNYGTLGHGRQHDEYFPRQIEGFPRGATATKAAAGSNCSLVLTENGHVYFMGVTKANADAVMKPQLVDALANNSHVVTHIGAGAGNVACCTEGGNTVVWGQGPYGELGLGSKKSSAKPAFVESLSGAKILDLACGLGNFLYVVDDDKDLPKVDLKAVEQALKP
jgi:alpha-tubulin suppressor-like RCC1 family protein